MIPINGLDLLVGLVAGALFLAVIARLQYRIDKENHG